VLRRDAASGQGALLPHQPSGSLSSESDGGGIVLPPKLEPLRGILIVT